jgi:hypothetical protein
LEIWGEPYPHPETPTTVGDDEHLDAAEVGALAKPGGVFGRQDVQLPGAQLAASQERQRLQVGLHDAPDHAPASLGRCGTSREFEELQHVEFALDSCRQLVRMRSSAKDQVHAVLAKLGIPVPCSNLFGAFGLTWLDGLNPPQPYAGKVTSLRQLIA